MLTVLAFAQCAAIAEPTINKAEPATPAPETAAPETSAQREARMAWWLQARFGMFIHWDPSCMLGTEISWSRHAARPLDIGKDPAGAGVDPVYDTLYQKFNPVSNDLKQWVAYAQDAGMKYLVIT